MDTTLVKGLKVLERLIQAEGPVGISALAQDLELQKSNVHRTLATLVQMGYVSREPTGQYRPTLRLWEQGTRVLRREPVRRAAVAFMQALHQETSETVNLVVLDGSDCLYLHQITAPRPIRASSPLGQRVKAIYPASGKALLAFQPDVNVRVKSICSQLPREEKSKVKVTALLEELANVRRTGFAFSFGAWRAGIHSVAGPIMGPSGIPVACIAVSGPAERMTRERMKNMSKAVLNACTETSSALSS
jgi:IclR family KDG regulon transcriptional repressor